MSQNTLIEKIKQDVAAAVADIQAAGKAQVDAIERETEATIAAMQEEHSAALAKKAAQLELVSLAKAKQEGNIAVQHAKRSAVDSVFSEVKTELEGQDADKYVAFFAAFAKEVVPADVEIDSVLAPAARADETAAILKQLNLSGDVVTEAAFKAGFIVYTKNGVYDVTLDRMLDEKIPALETAVFNQLQA